MRSVENVFNLGRRSRRKTQMFEKSKWHERNFEEVKYIGIHLWKIKKVLSFLSNKILI